MSSEIETSEKGEPVPLDVVATSHEIKMSEKGEPVPLDVAVMSSEIETSEKGNQFLLLQIPQRLLIDDNTIDMELFNRLDDYGHT